MKFVVMGVMLNYLCFVFCVLFLCKFTQCTTGGTDLGNLLQGGEAYVKFFAENAHFQGTVDCAPEYQSNTPRQETN